MADLYNLDAEIEDYSQQEEVLEEEDDDGNLDENETINDNDDNDEAADAQVPAALRELAAARHKSHDDEDEDSDALEEDLLNNTNANPSATTMAKARERLCDLAYTRLYRAWSQECRAPELLPWDRETVDRVTSMHDSDGTIDTGNANMDALLTSLLRIDAERGKFLLADLLKRRLQKIEAHAFFYDNNNNINTEEEQRIMSEHEVEFLKEYKAAVARHFQTTVTDHFPQDVWKQLDAPDMIDEPDLDAFVFFKCRTDVTIHDQPFAAGTCLIARYNRVRHFFLAGQVELM